MQQKSKLAPRAMGQGLYFTFNDVLNKGTQTNYWTRSVFVLPPESNTFSDGRRTCHVSWVKTH